MNNQKVEQALKEIFSRYGIEIVRDRNRFRSAVMDLLDPVSDKDEMTVLKYAMDTDALWIFLASGSVTGEASQRTVEQLIKEGHMREGDAAFVVQCVAAARSQSPVGATENEIQEHPDNAETVAVVSRTGTNTQGKPQKSDEWIVALILIGLAVLGVCGFFFGLVFMLL